MYTTCSELVVFMYWTGKSMNNLLSYCGLVDARKRASNKDLPVYYSYSSVINNGVAMWSKWRVNKHREVQIEVFVNGFEKM